MLLVQNVSFSYGKKNVLDSIQLELSKGIYGLLAPNGAGKTTLIKLLATLLYPNKGEILYEGQDIVGMDEQYRDLLGYLPQDFGYYKNYSGRQFLRYLASLKGLDKRKVNAKITSLLKLVAMEEAADLKMKKYSGGMIQRIGIAQALLNDPKVLILDEPTAGLDPKERVRFRNLLSELARDRIVILSTHIVSDVESIANEIILMKDNKILHKTNIEALCQMLNGKVYETVVSFEEANIFRKSYLSLSEKQESGKLKIRFITEHVEQGSSSGWNPVYPSLEDVFLYIYQDETAVEQQ